MANKRLNTNARRSALAKQRRELHARRAAETEAARPDMGNEAFGTHYPDSVTQAILDNPAQALAALDSLARMADQNADAEMVFGALPGILELAGEAFLAKLAESILLIFRARLEPKLAETGVYKLIEALESPEAASLEAREEALAAYRLILQSLTAGSPDAVADLARDLGAVRDAAPAPVLAGLYAALGDLAPVADALAAARRVESDADRMAQLGAAIERLGEIAHMTRSNKAIDRAIAQSIVEHWLEIVSQQMGTLQIRARIACQLVTRRAWLGDTVTLALQLRNDGRGAALNVRVRLSESPEYSPLDSIGAAERLLSGDETQLEFQARPHVAKERGHFRARFEILFDDPIGPDQQERYSEDVILMPSTGEFQRIPNPYVVGTPLQAGSPLFFGREDVFAFIEENLSAAHHNNLTLVGQRRTGKSSILKQLPTRLGDGFVPIYIDGQSVALEIGLSAFFLNVATEIAYALEDRGLGETAPTSDEFAESPASAFEHGFLRRVRDAIGERHLLLLLDEFEELEAMVQQGKLDTSIFGFLRHLIQHTPGLSVIFTGTHRLEELSTEYWSALINTSIYQHIGFLERTEAVRLIEAPVEAFGMRYDDLALDKLWRVTAGHPYFLQMLCHRLVVQHNRSKRSFVTVSDVTKVLGEILSSSEAHFVYLWAESTREERMVLAALSRMTPPAGRAPLARVGDYLSHRGVPLEGALIRRAVRHLIARDILTTQVVEDAEDGDEMIGWRLGLLAQWIEKYKSVTHAAEER